MKRIKLFATLRDMVGKRFLDVPFEDGGTVRELIDAIGQADPALKTKMLDKNGELSGVVHVMVDGRNVMWLQGMDTIIRAGDDIALIPPAAGG